MDRNQWGRMLAVAGSMLGGLASFFLCLGIVSAQAPDARPSAPAAGQTWFVAHTPGEGLVGYWKFDQVFDHNVFNSASAAIQTILTGGSSITTGVPITFTQFGTFPDFGALELDGVNGGAVVNDNAALDVDPTAFTVAAWVRRGATGSYDAIYDSGTETHKWWVFIADAAKSNRFGFGERGIAEFYSTRAITDTSWHHLAVVVNGSGASNLTFYVDGLASGTATANNISTPAGSKRVGFLLDTPATLSSFLNGDIDELRLYNRALSAAEVQRLAAGRGCVVEGTSWATAFGDLQCAIVAAGNGDQVWLAQGNFSPGTAREVSFHILNDLSLLGGFVGGETSPAQRPAFQPNAPLTGLSGDAAGDDLPDLFGHYAENACNVVTTGLNGIPGFAPSVSFDGLAIEDGNARCSFPGSSSGGGLANFSARALSFHNVVFQSNEANASGGGLSAFGQVSLSAVTFSRNKAASGGAMALSGAFGPGSHVTITASSFASNLATSFGGALEIADGGGPTTLQISGSSFSSNQSPEGGAIHDKLLAQTLDLTLNQVTFTGNEASLAGGGALENVSSAPGVVHTTINQGTFTENISDDSGGAIFNQADDLTVAGSQFTANSSLLNDGGAIAALAPLTVTSSTFMSNTATRGGALSVGPLVMSGTSVIANRAFTTGTASDFEPLGGGVIAGDSVLTNSQFFSNTALVFSPLSNNLAEGGGLAVVGSLQLRGSQFLGNLAEHGGGLFVQGSATIKNSLFQANNAGSGGGVFADGSLLLLSNRLVDNTALEQLTLGTSQGGGLFLHDGGLGSQVSNNLFLGNQAASESLAIQPHGAAMSIDGSITLVSNNTIVSRGVITVSAAAVTGTTGLFNNIITSHTVGIEALGGTTFDDYNLFSGDALTGSGLISQGGHSRVADPRFVAPAQDDYRLRVDSPAIDAGDNSRVPNSVTTDLAGGPRFADVPSVPDSGAGTPPIVDIGAFEASSLKLFLPLTVRQ